MLTYWEFDAKQTNKQTNRLGQGQQATAKILEYSESICMEHSSDKQVIWCLQKVQAPC